MPLDLHAPRTATTHAPAPRLLHVHTPDPAAQRAELLAGLQAEVARIAPKFFYDALGARLFSAITALPEYTPTRAEAGILRANRRHLRDLLPGADAFALIDLGAGTCEKGAALFDALPLSAYIAADIALPVVGESLRALQPLHPQLPMVGVGIDFTQAMELPLELELELGSMPRLLLYLGSSIGNFAPYEAEAFLRDAHATAGHGGALMIGVDLLKDPARMQAAYDDALGVTAAFNRNVLSRANRLAGTDFDLSDWQHVAFFDAAEGCVQMHLRPRRPIVTVSWPGGRRVFSTGQGIHTENSYKYTPEAFGALLQRAGWQLRACLTDAPGDAPAAAANATAGYAVFIAHA
jgi:dimethylhistidine N-methyltransferase